MKKTICLILTLAILMSSLVSVTWADEPSAIVANGVKLYSIASTQAEGYVNIQGETSKSKIKLMVVKDNEQIWYEVKLNNGSFNEQIWLNKGIGTYTIHIMVNESDRKYSYGPKLTVENAKGINPLLAPEKYIESADKLIVQKAQEITKGLTNDMDKANAIYKWVAENIKYDNDKYKKHLNNDYDNEYGALMALSSKTGVCYDYAALVAALGRAAGLQAKLIKGTGKINGTSGYHAWNEIYIADQSKWVKLDATFGAMSNMNYFNNENFDESHKI